MGKQTTPRTIAALSDGTLQRNDAENLYTETPKYKLWDVLWQFMDRFDEMRGDDAGKIAAIWQASRKR